MKKKSTTVKKILSRVGFIIIILALWELVYLLGVEVLGLWKSYTIPSPQGVWERCVDMFSFDYTGMSIYAAVGASLIRAFIGFAISVIIGAALGFLISKFKYLQENLKPIILGIQTLPSVCWVPFAILWFGLDQSAVIFVIIVGSAFSIAMAVDNGIQNVDPLYIRAAKTMGVSQSQLYFKVIIPAAQPMLIAGLKSGWSFAWRALMAAEMMISMIGLGQILDAARSIESDINKVTLIMLIIIVIGTIIDRVIFTNWENAVRRRYGLDRDKK